MKLQGRVEDDKRQIFGLRALDAYDNEIADLWLWSYEVQELIADLQKLVDEHSAFEVVIDS